MKDRLEIKFVEPNLDAYLKASSEILRSQNAIRLKPFNELAAAFASRAAAEGSSARFYAVKEDCEAPLRAPVQICEDIESTDATFLFVLDAKRLSLELTKYVDLEQGTLVAPITRAYCKKRPLFLISIPKSGTHLLYNLAERFGYLAGIVCPHHPKPGMWYCVEYSNSHTSARDFFIDTVRRSPFGNRDHPFIRSPAIFIYRNPMDILVSEANYYHKEGKTAFFPYLAGKSFEDRLLTLIDDPWLLGSIRNRIGNFIPWLQFQNVIPISFEELVGPRGGGSIEAQTRLIWSLQIKLHVPGNPRHYGDQVFDKDSPTFHEGQVGNHRKLFTEEAYQRFSSLPQDFMQLFGYTIQGDEEPHGIPKRAEEFRKRPLSLSETHFQETPIGVEYDFLGYNLAKYRGRFWGIPLGFGRVDLSKLDGYGFLKKLSLCQARDLNYLKYKICFRPNPMRLFPVTELVRKIRLLLPRWLTRWKGKDGMGQ
jgi:hypothetical protein